MPTRPPMPPPCASWRCGACAIRPSWRRGTRRAAPTACSSTSPAARISSAARSGCWPISSSACAPSGFTRAGDRRHGGRVLGGCPPWPRRTAPSCRRAARQAALHNLPLAALRLSRGQRSSLMRRLGLRRIGELMRPAARARLPRASRPSCCAASTRRWGTRPSRSFPSSRRPPIARRPRSLEPILSQEHVLDAATRLLRRSGRDLARDAVGARVLRLLLFRVETARCVSLDLGLAAPSRDARAHRPPDRPASRSPGRAISMPTSASRPRPCTCWLPSPCRSDRCGSASAKTTAAPDGLARLIDRLQQRLGAGAVRQLHPYQSHIPERAVRASRCSRRPFRVGRRCRGVAAPHPGPRPTEEWGEGTPPRPLAPAAAPRDGRRGGADPRGPAAAVPLARRAASGGRGARPRAHRAGMVAPDGRRRRATTTSSRTRRAAASGSTATASTAARRRHPALVRARGVRMSRIVIPEFASAKYPGPG